jgi:TrmH RNA methyltransferase
MPFFFHDLYIDTLEFKGNLIQNEPHSMRKELKYYGIHACLEIWRRRPQDLVRVYVNDALKRPLGPLLKWCASQKKAYHLVPEGDLEKISGSVHHEGVCVLAKERPLAALEQLESSLQRAMCLLYLDGVQNPHNLGSLLRSAAHFGIAWVLGEEGKLPALSPSACRIAKGAAEHVFLLPLKDPKKSLSRLLDKGFSILATSSHQGEPLHGFSFPERSILAIGSESDGLGKDLMRLSSNRLQIQGSGLVESLNVSVATALCLGEYRRRHPL